MESLRTRKPSGSRKTQRQPARVAKANAGAAPKKSKVDDKIKKRMSMRYADISAPTDFSGVPDVPSLPIGAGPARSGGQRDEYDGIRGERSKEDSKLADLKFLDKDVFDPDAYLKTKLANSTEAELKSLQSSLRASKDETAADLQKNVFKNYAEFVVVSKEIGVLENEMLELKESLSEWRSMPSLLHIEESTSAADRRRNVRSSIADLRVLYANQMQTLHAQIEGSTKFVPTTPGRHIVTEVDGILALNAATYKVEKTVKFVVLDDAVLVARRRRRKGADDAGGSDGGKLVAERCWPLGDMLVLDTKDTATMTNVFKIRHGKETHVYRTEASSGKKSLLSHLRQAAEELATKKRKEREGEHERRKSLWVGGDTAGLSLGGDKVPPLPDWMAAIGQNGVGTSAKEKAERDARWVGEFADELTVAIALHEWDQAVDLVEQGEEKLSTTPMLASKLPTLSSTLVTSLLHDLSSPTLRKSTVVHLISLLNRLHAGAAARTTFLAARGEAMRKRIRSIRFEGHVGLYVNELAMVMFTGIKHTADWFLASFKENDVASCFVDWAKRQVETYAEIFRKQVYMSDVDPQTVKEALHITHAQSRKLLEEFGLDFRFLLNEILVEKPKVTVTPGFSSHPRIQIKQPIPTRNPAATPSSVRSPQNTPPVLTSPIQSPPLPGSPPNFIAAPTPIPARMRSPVPPSKSASPVSSRATPPRSLRSSPAPPPKSRERPESAATYRPPPIAVPRSEGMF